MKKGTACRGVRHPEDYAHQLRCPSPHRLIPSGRRIPDLGAKLWRVSGIEPFFSAVSSQRIVRRDRSRVRQPPLTWIEVAGQAAPGAR
jgi:hypothetical protein